MKLKFFTLLVFSLFAYNVQGQVTVNISDMTYDYGASISNCGTIDFEDKSTVTLNFFVDLEKPIDETVGDGELRIYTKKSSSDPRISRLYLGIDSGSWWLSGGKHIVTRPLSITLYASDYNVNGGLFYAVFKSSGNDEYTSCNYSLKKDNVPTFKITPSSTTVSCNSTSPKTFTVNNVYNSPGTLSYDWEVGSGWKYNGNPVSNFTTTSNTIELTPFLYPPSDVKVTTVLNSVSYPRLTSTVTLENYDPPSSITGDDVLCNVSTSTYAVDNLPSGSVILSWSSSDENIATINPLNSYQASLTKKSVGSVTISAILENSCGQQKTIETQVWTGGKPSITLEYEPQVNYVYLHLIGDNNTDINSQGITSTTWEELSNDGGCHASFGGSGFEGMAHGNCTNWSVYVKITATNSCGTTTIYRTITPPAPECEDDFNIVSNPMKSGGSINSIIIDPCEEPLSRSSSLTPQSYTITIYDKYGEIVYQETQIEKRTVHC